MGDRLAIVVGSSGLDRLHAAAALVAGSAAAGLETHVFLVHAGLAAFRREALAAGQAPVPVAAAVGAAAGGAGGPGPADPVSFVNRRLVETDAPGWADVLREAKEIGDVRVHACASSLHLLGEDLDALDPMVDDVLGIAAFLELYDGARAMYI